jgi:hypothetical protein
MWFYFHVAVATDKRMYTKPDIAWPQLTMYRYMISIWYGYFYIFSNNTLTTLVAAC